MDPDTRSGDITWHICSNTAQTPQRVLARSDRQPGTMRLPPNDLHHRVASYVMRDDEVANKV